MIQGYIFDLDGVITDTAEFHYKAWQRLADEEGLPFSREDNEALRGVSRRRSLEILLKGKEYPEEQMQDFMERKNNYYRDFLHEISPRDLLPGVAEFLHEAQAAGLKLGLASASKNARDVMQGLGILAMFQVLGDGYSVVNPKPAPDLFIWVAGGFGLSPAQCIVFEDAEAGIDAALAGGFWTVGLGPVERVGKAHRQREDLRGATVAEFAPMG
jgi:beta-phosphoglucomutase